MNWKAVLAIIVCNILFMSSSYTMLIPFLPLYLTTELGVAPEHVNLWSGIVFSSTFAVSAVMAPIWGRLADTRGKRVMAMRASFLLSVSYFLGGIVETPGELTAMRMFQGFAAGLWPMDLAIMTLYAPPKKLGFCLGVMQGTLTAGGVTGQNVAGKGFPFGSQIVQVPAKRLADVTDDERVELVREVRLLQHGHEGVRGDEPELGVSPAGEGLDAAELARERADLGLVVDLYQPRLYCGLEVLDQVLVHTDEEIEDELSTVVQNGGRVRDVFVWHKIYGKIEAPLKIQTALDVTDYMESLKSGRSRPLKNVTYEYHYHTIEADTEEILDQVEQALDKKGYLVREN